MDNTYRLELKCVPLEDLFRIKPGVRSDPGGGGGGTQVQRGGGGGAHLRYVFRGRRGLFLRPLHVRDFVKEGYFFVPRYEVLGSKSPYNPRTIRSSDAE